MNKKKNPTATSLDRLIELDNSNDDDYSKAELVAAIELGRQSFLFARTLLAITLLSDPSERMERLVVVADEFTTVSEDDLNADGGLE